ncbi:thiamine-phosphate kinase [Cocleimonas flava]|uniref:Thiamine-monophosphate kinase n=1 Tax=Cocleimonas flava TaxID=634765 RepID=A0A4R1EZ38_9GAMM|nr:thiamine-phosphate kinase [Cocleimonas flava]TCJ87137.1 thiamine-phosphate kinase [Cocleimonas flava]
MGEFDLIETYFRWDNESDFASEEGSFSDNSNVEDNGVKIGIGDDAAVLQLEHNHQLVTSIDTLISGVHFPEQTSPEAIGHKALAVNLSDLAAMGAKAKWFTLALTLPGTDHVWLKGFSSGLKKIANQHSVSLVGGDTTRGPLAISIQVMGTIENNQSLLRSGAQADDKIFVTGTPGDAAVGLASIQGVLDSDNLILSSEDKTICEARLNYPTARLKESEIIKEYATSCIDVSDGLLQDLGHILKKSKVSAVLDPKQLPLSESLQKMPQDTAIHYALNGGDDYELLFTVPVDKCETFMQAVSEKITTRVTMIGEITSNSVDEKQESSVILDPQGFNLRGNGYNHFNDDVNDGS